MKKSENNIVAEIHEAIDTAQDKLLQEAKDYLATIDEKQIEKSSRLSNIGFTNSKTVKFAEEQVEGKVINEELAELVNYYKDTYPFLKFLTENRLEKICKKYNLIFAPVERYLEDVPDKNILEIENAQVLFTTDLIENYHVVNIKSYWNGVSKEVQKFLSTPRKIIPISSKSISDKEIMNLLIENGFSESNWGEYIFNKATVVEVKKGGLFICAPPSHFKLEGLLNKGMGFFNKNTYEIQDPIVFRYVRGGCQVLTKWGDEASDPDLVVDKLN